MTSNFKNKHCHEDLTSDTESRHAHRAVSIGRAGNKRNHKEEERKKTCLVLYPANAMDTFAKDG